MYFPTYLHNSIKQKSFSSSLNCCRQYFILTNGDHKWTTVLKTVCVYLQKGNARLNSTDTTTSTSSTSATLKFQLMVHYLLLWLILLWFSTLNFLLCMKTRKMTYFYLLGSSMCLHEHKSTNNKDAKAESFVFGLTPYCLTVEYSIQSHGNKKCCNVKNTKSSFPHHSSMRIWH